MDETWNARDLDGILAHYARDVEFISPFVSRFLSYKQNNCVGLRYCGPTSLAR